MVGGAVTGGLAGGLAQAARGGAMGAELATHVAKSGNPAVSANMSKAADTAIRVGRHARNAGIGAVSGGTGSAASELTRQTLNGEQTDIGQIVAAGVTEARSASPCRSPGPPSDTSRGARTRGQVVGLSTDPDIQQGTVNTNKAGTVPNNNLILATHANSAEIEINGARGPFSNLAPHITSNPSQNVTLLACEAAQNEAALKNLAESTGRTLTAFWDKPEIYESWTQPMVFRSTVFGGRFVSATPTVIRPDTNSATNGTNQVWTVGVTVPLPELQNQR